MWTDGVQDRRCAVRSVSHIRWCRPLPPTSGKQGSTRRIVGSQTGVLSSSRSGTENYRTMGVVVVEVVVVVVVVVVVAAVWTVAVVVVVALEMGW